MKAKLVVVYGSRTSFSIKKTKEVKNWLKWMKVAEIQMNQANDKLLAVTFIRTLQNQ